MKGIDVKLDKAWRDIVKKRAGGKCEYCGKEQHLNSHHIFGRRNRSGRWLLANSCCLCAGCHTLSSKFSAHQTPTEFTRWIIDLRGDDWYQELRDQVMIPKKWTKAEKAELLKELEQCLENEKTP